MSNETINFAITGVGGYIAPRHLNAIYKTGNRVVAALDPNDSVGLLDSYAYDISFFTEFERFDRHLEKLRRENKDQQVHMLSICSPNFLHDAHCRLALRIGADAICEKPLVINPWNLDALQELEFEYDKHIYTILQLRVHPKVLKLREQLLQTPRDKQHDVIITYITPRGNWYHVSWKGNLEKSGGIVANIGIHLFDLLIWLFGDPYEVRLYHSDSYRVSGYLALERAQVKWFLSTDHRDLQLTDQPEFCRSYRSIRINDKNFEFSSGFDDLHTIVYEEILSGRGFRIGDARPSINLIHKIRNAELLSKDDKIHPILK